MIILLSGKAGSGKDTVADYLVENHGYIKIAFADALRDTCCELSSFVMDDFLNRDLKNKRVDCDLGGISMKLSPREVLQLGGTIIRKIQYYLWSDIVIDKIRNLEHVSEHFVVSDCRFDSEIEAIGKYFDDVKHIRITRPGLKKINHLSENSLTNSEPDYIIENIGTIEDLHDKLTGSIL